VTPGDSQELRSIEGVLGGDRRVPNPCSVQAVLARWKTLVRAVSRPRGRDAADGRWWRKWKLRRRTSGRHGTSDLVTEPLALPAERRRGSAVQLPHRAASKGGAPRVAPATARERAKHAGAIRSKLGAARACTGDAIAAKIRDIPSRDQATRIAPRTRKPAESGDARVSGTLILEARSGRIRRKVGN